MISTRGSRNRTLESRASGSYLAGLALTALAACSSAPQNVASKFVKTASVGPAGATIVVTPSDDQTLGGTSITIPPNALHTTTAISIGISNVSVVTKAPSGSIAIGPVVDFAPSGTIFAVPVTITLPVMRPSGNAPSQVFVEAVEDDGSARQVPAQYTGGLATIQVSGFTSFGGCSITPDSGVNSAQDAGIPACRTDSDCGRCGACVSGVCEALRGCLPDAGPVTCGSTPVVCNGNRTDLSIDPANCGACGLACSAGQSCACGVCGGAPAQDAGVPACRTDSDCGVCEACSSGVCIAASCLPDAGPVTCGSTPVVCNGNRTDLSIDPTNCGACGVACFAGQSCACGVCK